LPPFAGVLEASLPRSRGQLLGSPLPTTDIHRGPLHDALWAYKTAYKNPMGMSPYKMVYRKVCYLPLELEHKAFWAVRELNRDFKLAVKKRLLDLEK
jgi:hypothetical protein